VTRATATPAWWAFWVLFKHRTLSNYRNGAFLGSRMGDKVSPVSPFPPPVFLSDWLSSVHSARPLALQPSHCLPS
jgi:hypothetical protein